MKTHIAISSLLFAASLALASPAPPASTPVTLNFRDIDVREILPLYESLTHFKIIRDNFFQGKVTISVAEPVLPEKAIEIIERTLFANGFAIIQVAPDTVEMVGVARNGRGNGIPTISDPAYLPAQERLVSYLFKFKYARAKDVQQVFAQYLSPPKSYTSFLRVEDANAVWLTERTSVIRQLLVAVEKIDVPAAQQGHVPP